jgi:hypothetical protein
METAVTRYLNEENTDFYVQKITKQNKTKVFLVLKCSSTIHEGVWSSGCRDPRFLYLGVKAGGSGLCLVHAGFWLAYSSTLKMEAMFLRNVD